MNIRNTPLLLISAVALTSVSSAQLTIDYSVTNSINSLGGLGSGQTFFPEDATGYAGQSSLRLTDLSFWSGNLGGAGHTTTYVAIYDGNPDTGTLIGTSTNFNDTSSAAGLANYTELVWSFDSLALNAATEYWAVISNSTMDVNPINTVGRSLQVFDPNASAYRGTSIIANRSPHGSRLDLRFRASFANAGGIGTNYCGPAAMNSTGAPGTITVTGNIVASMNDVTLVASDLPLNAFGFFLTSQAQGFVMNPGGSQGNLCLGGAIGRYVGSGQIQNSGGIGEISLLLDLTLTPTPTGFVTVSAGETWSFQAWHRDAIAGSATSNFTDGVQVLFQ